MQRSFALMRASLVCHRHRRNDGSECDGPSGVLPPRVSDDRLTLDGLADTDVRSLGRVSPPWGHDPAFTTAGVPKHADADTSNDTPAGIVACVTDANASSIPDDRSLHHRSNTASPVAGTDHDGKLESRGQRIDGGGELLSDGQRAPSCSCHAVALLFVAKCRKHGLSLNSRCRRLLFCYCAHTQTEHSSLLVSLSCRLSRFDVGICLPLVTRPSCRAAHVRSEQQMLLIA